MDSPFVVTLSEVSEAITKYNLQNPNSALSTRNPANFFKDFIRNRASANRNWPSAVFDAGFTARQVTRQNACFEFIRVAENQLVPFPDVKFAAPTDATPKHFVESVSLPMASRKLGRADEPWLIQVITRLRIVESHFSLASQRNIVQIDLLQMSVKLSGTEIDAIFLGQEMDSNGGIEEVIITCEAKGKRDDILEDQILRQAKAPFSMKQITQERVIPIAVKCMPDSSIYVVEFAELTRDTYLSAETISIVSDSVFVIKPSVPGI